jgi:hypothetical protein
MRRSRLYYSWQDRVQEVLGWGLLGICAVATFPMFGILGKICYSAFMFGWGLV